MSTSELQITEEGGCLRLALNRPERGNALSRSLVAEIEAALEEARRLKPRLLVIDSTGANFCTGFDLSDLESETDDTLLARFVRVELMLQSVASAPFPTLAIARGHTLGAGADLFCACSRRWIAGDAAFAFPGAAFGLVLGSARLADTLGARTAQDWIQRGAKVDASAALAAGLAHERLAPEALQEAQEALLKLLGRLDEATHASIHEATDGARRPRGAAGDAADLARLVDSAARPGIKARIEAYRAQARTGSRSGAGARADKPAP